MRQRYLGTTSSYGFFLDDITVTNSRN